MFGASVYDLYKSRAILSFDNGAVIAVGFVVAFFAALFVVRWLVDFVSQARFRRLRLVPHRRRHDRADRALVRRPLRLSPG